MFIKEARSLKEFLMHEVYCTDGVLNKIDYAEMEDNYNLRKIAI
jgi:hypothetical protein